MTLNAGSVIHVKHVTPPAESSTKEVSVYDHEKNFSIGIFLHTSDFWVETVGLFSSSLNYCLLKSIKNQKKVEISCYKFPESKMTSSVSLFCWYKSPKPAEIQFKIMLS